MIPDKLQLWFKFYLGNDLSYFLSALHFRLDLTATQTVTYMLLINLNKTWDNIESYDRLLNNGKLYIYSHFF